MNRRGGGEIRRVAWIATACLLASAACTPARLVAEAPTSPKDVRFVSKRFTPTVSLVPGTGWRAILDFPHSLTVDDGDPPALRFAIVSAVFDPESQRVIDPPKDLQAWILANPLLEATPPVPVMIGGIQGTQIDARAVKAPRVPYEMRGRFCPLPGCFGLLVAGTIIDGQTGSMFRLILVKADGQDVLVEMDAVGEDWPSFLARAEKVLGTVSFASTG
jgi:hypothetical protein